MTTGGEPTATDELKTPFAYPGAMGAEATTARRVSPAREEKYRARRSRSCGRPTS
jgi:hypothetical protein